MNRPWWLYAIAIACMALIFVSAQRFQSVERRAESAERRLTSVRAMASEITQLRARSERVFLGQRPTEDTIAQINATLASAGLPSNAFRSLDPDADTALEGGYRRQSVRLTLEPLTPAQLGDFLIAWESVATPWIISGIELAHRPRASDASYTVRLVLSATYIDPDGRPA